jgi:hypothetical protein
LQKGLLGALPKKLSCSQHIVKQLELSGATPENTHKLLISKSLQQQQLTEAERLLKYQVKLKHSTCISQHPVDGKQIFSHTS